MQFKNWKTTVAGVATILVAVGNAANAVLQGQPLDMTSLITTIIAGIGLVFAKDHNVTGGNVVQQ